MLHLDEILERPVSEEAFLEAQRARFRDLFEKDRAAVIAEAKDEAARAEILRRAKLALDDMYTLPGTGGKPFYVGTPPAWRECRSENPEYLWGLARMEPLADLTRAYLVTGDETYAKKAIENVENFILTCPAIPIEYCVDIPDYMRFAFSAGTTNPWRQLEVGERMSNSWMTLYTHLLHSPQMTPRFHALFACSVYEHERQLRFVSPLLWPNGAHNHYLFENVGLLCATILFPDFKNREEWQTFAVHELERCSEKQIMQDGAQLEGCPGYHAQCVSAFIDIIAIAARYGIDFSEDFYDRINRMISYQAWTFKPAGGCAPLGDSCQIEYKLPHDAARYFAARGTLGAFENMALLLSRPDPDLLPEADYLAACERARAAKGGVHHFPSVGQIIGRTGYTPEDSYFSLMCHTPVFNGHMHCDPLSVEVTLSGKDAVIDPSIFAYTENETRKMYKSAYYHSCLTFGGKEPFDYLTTWTYTEQKPGSTVMTYEGDGFLAGDGSHENYAPNVHERLALLSGKHTFAVVDYVENKTGEDLQIYFHLDRTGYEKTAYGTKKGEIRVFAPTESFELVDAEQSPRWDVAIPSTRLVCRDGNRAETATFVTVVTEDESFVSASAEAGKNGVTLTLAFRDRTERYLWQFGKSLEKIS